MFNVWLQAVTNPTEEGYQALLKEAHQNTIVSPVMWVAVAGVINALLSFASNWIMREFFLSELGGLSGAQAAQFGQPELPFLAICLTPLLAPIGFLINAGITYISARAFKGEGSFEIQAYLQAAGAVPLGILSSILMLIPFAGSCLALVITLYIFYLTILTVKVVHGLEWGYATAAVILPIVAFCGVIFACMMSVIMMGGGLESFMFELQRLLQP